MRNILLVLCVGVMLISCATAGPIPPEQTNFSKSYETTLSKDEVYNKGLEWIAKTFQSAKAVIEYQDKEAGKIIGKGSVDCPIGPIGTVIPVLFTITIEAKEGKYRIVFENLQLQFRPGDIGDFFRPYDLKAAHAKLQVLCDDFQRYLSAPKEEW